MPFLFIYNPVFLLRGDFIKIIIAILTAFVGIIFVSSGIIGYFNKKINFIIRILFIGGGFLLFLPGIKTNLLAFPLILMGLGMIYIPAHFMNICTKFELCLQFT